MWTNVLDLKRFYQSPLGRTARRMIARRITEIWPSVSGLDFLGIGYPIPYLSPFTNEARRVAVVMPPRQGVIRWPAEGSNRTVLAHQAEMPFPNLTFDRVLIVHAFESAGSLRPMLREVWRVMSDSGRLLVVAPNRTGIWARTDSTPFGAGLPYSAGQLDRALRDCLYAPERTRHALFAFPSSRRLSLSLSPTLERLGLRFFATFSGVILMEATKQIHAGAPEGTKRRTLRIGGGEIKAVPAGRGMRERS